MFDLSIFKIAILLVIALIVFGPEQLPRMAAQAGRALRDVRRLAEGARADLQQHLGPEFSEFDLNDLNPKHFVRKHLLEGMDADEVTTSGTGTSVAGIGTEDPAQAGGDRLLPGEQPPFDAEAT